LAWHFVPLPGNPAARAAPRTQAQKTGSVRQYIQGVTPASWDDLASQFALGRITTDPQYVTRGAMGEIWRLETSGGRWAVKCQFPWAPADPRPADIAVQRAAAQAGIPLPLPATTPDGSAVATIDGRPARVYEWVDLRGAIELPAPAATAAEAGRLLGLLHGLALAPQPENGHPIDPWYTEVPDVTYWAGLVGRAKADGATWAPSLAAARGLIADLTELVLPPPPDAPLIICHRDFNPDNVFPAAHDGRLVVLDWENCGPLSADREVGYAVFTWCSGNGEFDQAAADALLAGYASASGAATAVGPDFFATAVATHLNVLRVMAEQALAEPEHRRFAEGFIADLLNRDLSDLWQLTKLSLSKR